MKQIYTNEYAVSAEYLGRRNRQSNSGKQKKLLPFAFRLLPVCAERKRGTTLIELLVVLVVLAALVSISAPSIGSLVSPKQILRSDARDVNRLLATARLKAIQSNCQIEVLIDSASREIRAQESGYFSELDDFGNEVFSTNHFQKSVTLSDGVLISTLAESSFSEVERYGEDETPQIAIRFSSLGSCDGGGIRLMKDSASLTLVCDVLTGRPSVE